jgi:hypothetical protein
MDLFLLITLLERIPKNRLGKGERFWEKFSHIFRVGRWENATFGAPKTKTVNLVNQLVKLSIKIYLEASKQQQQQQQQQQSYHGFRRVDAS